MKKEGPRKIAFLDRDGVINKKAPEHSYITKPDEFVFTEGIFEVLTKLKDDGYEFIVITNQRGIARNLMTSEDLEVIHQHMREGMTVHGIELLDIFFCPHNHNECDCRKPKPGLLQAACEKYDVDLPHSLLISDSLEEVEMGKKFGIEFSYFIPSNKPKQVLKTLHQKIKIAFVKYGGLSTGGSEKMLQIIAANLPKERFDVTYFYCAAGEHRGAVINHPSTDEHRKSFLVSHGVKLVEFTVGTRDLTTPSIVWKDTNFWQEFKEEDFDIVQIVRAGHKEFPFSKIRRTPIIDIIALDAGVDNQYNIARTLHICSWSAKRWISRGGNPTRSEIISLPIPMPTATQESLRSDLSISKDIFVYGMHQRQSDDIFSTIPLKAYKKIESNETAFILLGGSDKYKILAEKLKIKNIYFLPATGNTEYICRFLSTLNVYAHGRKDGEVNSQAIAEAMYFGLPIVSHKSTVNNGHVECIGEAGVVVDTDDVATYAAELERLRVDTQYYAMRSIAARQRFADNYELHGQMKRIESIYESVITNPFPHPITRILYSLHWTQNIRILLKWMYLKTKYCINGKV